jgi:mono/diheme cytochrome c family protein
MKKYLALIPIIAAIIVFAACGGNENNSQVPPPEAAPVASEGKALFSANCAICHSLKQDKTGPALEGALTRWHDDTTKLKSFIRNSQAFIATGDPYANDLYNRWSQAGMNAFPNLTDHELDAIIDYIRKGE